MQGIDQKLKVLAKKAVTSASGLADSAQKEFIEGLIDSLNLKEMLTILRLVQTGKFSLEDLMDLAQHKAQQEAQHALARTPARTPNRWEQTPQTRIRDTIHEHVTNVARGPLGRRLR